MTTIIELKCFIIKSASHVKMSENVSNKQHQFSAYYIFLRHTFGHAKSSGPWYLGKNQLKNLSLLDWTNIQTVPIIHF